MREEQRFREGEVGDADRQSLCSTAWPMGCLVAALKVSGGPRNINDKPLEGKCLSQRR